MGLNHKVFKINLGCVHIILKAFINTIFVEVIYKHLFLYLDDIFVNTNGTFEECLVQLEDRTTWIQEAGLPLIRKASVTSSGSN